jgi:N-acetylmuramoyl-L-alanine amidase
VHLNSDGPEAVGIETLVHKAGTVADKWGKLVQKKMVEATNDRDRGIKYRTDLAVLNGTQMPAILVECGFISHPETEAKFRTSDYQRLLAQAIYDGTQEYLAYIRYTIIYCYDDTIHILAFLHILQRHENARDD